MIFSIQAEGTNIKTIIADVIKDIAYELDMSEADVIMELNAFTQTDLRLHETHSAYIAGANIFENFTLDEVGSYKVESKNRATLTLKDGRQWLIHRDRVIRSILE